MSILKLAWRNIISRPLDILLSLILFALGIGLISFLLVLNSQLKDKFDNNLAGIDMVIGAKGSPLQMILCNMYHIDNPTGNISVKEAKPFLNPNHPLIETAVPLSLGDNYKSFRIVGTDYSILDLYNVELQNGALWEQTNEVTIGYLVAQKAGLKIGDSFDSTHGMIQDDNLTHDHAGLTVKGIFALSGTVVDQLILTSTSSIWEVHEHESPDHSHDHEIRTISKEDLVIHENKEITSILIKFKNRANFQALSMPRAINENTDLQAASPAIEINRLYAMIGTGTEALRILAIIIAIVSALSIFISLLKSLKSRKYELALIRVLGANKTKILVLILLEGIIISILGFVFGLLLSHGFLGIMSGYLTDTYQYNFSGLKFVSAEFYLLILALALGFVAALLPAMQASKADINQILAES